MAHKPRKLATSPFLLIHVHKFTTAAGLEHSDFPKVKVPSTAPHDEVQIRSLATMPRAIQILTHKGGPTVFGRNPSSSFLTATTVRYATEAGITAAAGTELVLQLASVKRFQKWSPFPRLPLLESTPNSLLPATVMVGQSSTTESVSSAPSPESNPNSLLPVTDTVGQYPTVKSR